MYVSNIFNFSGSKLYLFCMLVFVGNIILYLNIAYLYDWISICTNIFKHSPKKHDGKKTLYKCTLIKLQSLHLGSVNIIMTKVQNEFRFIFFIELYNMKIQILIYPFCYSYELNRQWFGMIFNTMYSLFLLQLKILMCVLFFNICLSTINTRKKYTNILNI